MSRVDDLWSSGLVHLLWVMVQFWSIGSLHRDLTKLASVIRRALAFISRTALASIHAWKVANNWKESRKRNCCKILALVLPDHILHGSWRRKEQCWEPLFFKHQKNDCSYNMHISLPSLPCLGTSVWFASFFHDRPSFWPLPRSQLLSTTNRASTFFP